MRALSLSGTSPFCLELLRRTIPFVEDLSLTIYGVERHGPRLWNVMTGQPMLKLKKIDIQS